MPDHEQISQTKGVIGGLIKILIRAERITSSKGVICKDSGRITGGVRRMTNIDGVIGRLSGIIEGRGIGQKIVKEIRNVGVWVGLLQ